eukprot:TRINITY_DN3267_c0_g1_i5.p1 TRINITY_DN3267_c0_g1~~TRINITY_DN3267_c0_g1_i5.p1  ORF type:complete len:741 (-),score=123.12 TRINITY_DN3267_c0_g1_i5:2081-4303(-)
MIIRPFPPCCFLLLIFLLVVVLSSSIVQGFSPRRPSSSPSSSLKHNAVILDDEPIYSRLTHDDGEKVVDDVDDDRPLGLVSSLPPVVARLVRDAQAFMDATLDPCQDFYQYACGTFIKNNPVPDWAKNQPYLNIPDIMDVQNSVNDWMRRVVRQPWPLLNAMYSSCMRPADVLQANAKKTYLKYVKETETTDLSSLQSRIDYLSGTISLSFDAFFELGLYTIQDDCALLSYVTMVVGGNTFQDVSQYDVNSPTYAALLAEITKAFSLFESGPQVSIDAASVLAIEATIANISASSAHVTPENVTLAQFTKQTNIDWTEFFGDVLYMNEYAMIGIGQEPQDYLTYLADLNETEFRRFLEWKMYQGLSNVNIAPCLNMTEQQALTSTGVCRYISWTVIQSGFNWNQGDICLVITNIEMGDYIGMIFSTLVVTDDLANDIHTMTDDIHNAFAASLPDLDWLIQNSSNIPAVEFKLKNIIQNIGHSNVMDKYDGVAVGPNFFDNFVSVSTQQASWGLTLARDAYNRSEEFFPAELVNAFYDPERNTINFPAGILESPIYSSNWPALWQYARLGYIVGHESIHGFDNQGSHYNAFGCQVDIFDNETRMTYDKQASCIADLYSKFIAYGNVTMNGNKTLGENIADIGGVKNAFRAYQAYVARNGTEFVTGELLPNMSTDQIFFLIMGQSWCSVENELFLEQQYRLDVHSPARYRVNGPLSQFDQFAKAYSCPAGSPMNPQTRCDLW